MRFGHIEVLRFGPLTGVDSGPSDLPGLVAVVGPNEAGKSAFHQVLVTTLYGFYPATREQNPYSPWGGGNAEIKAQLGVNGGAIDVHRRLLASPQGRVVHGDQVEKLYNRSLPPVERVDRRVYSEVYAITLVQLAGLREAAWETVQEQLIVGLGAQDLRSARAAIRGFRDTAKKLWQPTKRGNQRYRGLLARLAELSQSRREAEIRDAELREVDTELSRLRRLIHETEEARAERLDRLEVLRELLPLSNRVRKLDELEHRLGDLEALAKVPKDPVGRDQELTERMERSEVRVRLLTEELNRVRSTTESLSEVERGMLSRADALRALASNAALVNEHATRRETIEQEITRLEGGIQEATLPLLGALPRASEDSESAEQGTIDWDAAGKPFRALEMAGLRERVAEAEDARRTVESLRERIEALGEPTPEPAPLVSVSAALLVAASIFVLLLGVFQTDILIAILGVLLLLLAGSFLARSWSRRAVLLQVREAGLGEMRALLSRIADAEGRERLAVASARKLLIPLGLQASYLDAPVGGLVERIGEIKNLFHQRHDRQVELRRMTDEDAALDAEFDRIVPSLELDLPEDRGLALLEVGRTLQRLDERRIRIEEAEAEKARIEASLDSERRELEEVSELRRSFDECVQRAGASSDEEGLRGLAQRLSDLEMLGRLTAELEYEAGNLSELRRRLEEAESIEDPWSEDLLAREQAALDGMDREIQKARQRMGQLEEREKSLLGEDTLDLVDGQILHLRSVLRDVERERDRNLALANLVERAEAQFRAEHQPDLLRRAEQHLGTITSGRYERILVGKEDDHGFFLDAEHLPEPIPVAPPLSTGTREQVYFALRLAIVEHLDRDSEPLPLLLDEVLVNWDPERRARLLDLLEQLATARQIFVFTCHPHIAEEIEERGGALISLNGAA